MRLGWVTTFTAAILLIASASTEGQEPRKLNEGFSEQSLRPDETHVYVISLDDGTAVLGQAYQHGVDLVSDEFGPDGS